MNFTDNAGEPSKETPLNIAQRTGIDTLGLSEANVRTANFGMHTVEGINNLTASNRAANNNAAFNMLQGLNAIQTEGVVSGLTQENVTTENFGEHTLLGIDHLLFQDETLTPEAAFNTVSGLKNAQVRGIITYQLTPEQVRTENFGEHTLEGIRTLTDQQENLSNQEAFQQIAALNAEQTVGFTDFQLTREQLENPVYSTTILNTMVALKELNPTAGNEIIYDYAMQMPEYQARAIANFGFSPQELGIKAVNNGFEQIDTQKIPIASGSTVDAAAFLMQEYRSPQDARATAYELNTTQVIGMVDLGLTLEQVQHPFFESAEEVLNSIVEELQGADGEIELPLPEQNKDQAREILAKMMLEATTKDALKDLDMLDDISVMSNTSTNLENIEPLDYRKPLEGTDINEFLKYASSLEELDILDTIKNKITEESLKESAFNKNSPEASALLFDKTESPSNNSTASKNNRVDFSAFKTPSSPTSKNKEENSTASKTPLSPRKNKKDSPEPKPKRRKL